MTHPHLASQTIFFSLIGGIILHRANSITPFNTRGTRSYCSGGIIAPLEIVIADKKVGFTRDAEWTASDSMKVYYWNSGVQLLFVNSQGNMYTQTHLCMIILPAKHCKHRVVVHTVCTVWANHILPCTTSEQRERPTAAKTKRQPILGQSKIYVFK